MDLESQTPGETAFFAILGAVSVATTAPEL